MNPAIAEEVARQGPCWWDIAVNSAPFVLLILFWVFFVRMAKKGTVQQRDIQERQRLHMERVEQLLERAVTALERNSKT